MEPNRIIVVDPCDATREVLARRLRAQGHTVDEAADPAQGADMALCSPPSAVVADLWMPSISGIQLCRLLRSEPGTESVAIILCGENDDPRNRFWAEHGGANAYVSKRRTGELVRAIARAIAASPTADGFFCQLGANTVDIRDRIARHLDKALFDSVIASEVRALATAGAFDRLFDLLVQFLSQVGHYRWVAISMGAPERLALHHHPQMGPEAEAEACVALGLPAASDPTWRIADEDATLAPLATAAVVRDIPFGNARLGKIALSPRTAADAEAATTLLSLVARELGGPLRMASFIEEAQQLASTDTLTGLKNRRAFASSMRTELARTRRHGYPLSLILLDIDHFKQINDRFGHGGGDRVLASLGLLLTGGPVRETDLVARWGGEEFVVSYLSTGREGALVAAEHLRSAIERLVIRDDNGEPIRVTASIGLAEHLPGESLESLVDRADRAMYASKVAGRNRVTASDGRDPRAPNETLIKREAERANESLG